jgi:hypothetical protein
MSRKSKSLVTLYVVFSLIALGFAFFYAIPNKGVSKVSAQTVAPSHKSTAKHRVRKHKRKRTHAHAVKCKCACQN